MLNAETLRRASALIRERAMRVVRTYAPMPERKDIDMELGVCDGCAQEKALVAAYPDQTGVPWLCVDCAAQADHEGSWTPAVALALSDWLDRTAVDGDNGYDDSDDNFAAALAVASAYIHASGA